MPMLDAESYVDAAVAYLKRAEPDTSALVQRTQLQTLVMALIYVLSDLVEAVRSRS